ncbi:hypothetical protein IFM89_012668 [Coptis chinensis]|uniref:WRKY domain-containing protein n=1 Tax=Coptis chinensis TaxID=261450 RepID=A0A835H4V1_9MAGN|nr:hypothetical protein IFM89_012668 [Coptis chinensis]
MEAQDAERTVIAKPVASRPSCSSLNSFSALLSGSISTTSPSSFSETAVAAIRPKTVRIKSAVNQASVSIVSSQGDLSATAGCSSATNILNPEIRSTVIYKPLAKPVSSRTALLLANLENFDIGHHNAVLQMQPQVEYADHANYHMQTQLTSNLHQNMPSRVKANHTSESSYVATQNLEENQRVQLSATSGDRPSYDGYNWRKYGQKQVKGSEYPRSYYKCTHPSCTVKKKIERSFDGQIAEIVYRGEHNHSKPQPPKRHSLELQEQGVVSEVTGQETGNPLWSEGCERRTENRSEGKLSLDPSYPCNTTNSYDSVMFGVFNNGVGITDNSCGLSEDREEGSRGVHAEDNAPKFKRRKNDHQSNEVGILDQGAQEPHVVVQSSTDAEVLGDGFRWRKYGQKVVKGNPYPRYMYKDDRLKTVGKVPNRPRSHWSWSRSYYRCTSIKCNVRKHVERAMDDPRAFITTYEGKHNHEMPTRGNNPVASEPNSAAPSHKHSQ